MSGEESHLEPVDLEGRDVECGGHLLRSALSVCLVTGRPFRLRGLHERQESSGLRPQHLAYVRAAEALGGGTSEGAVVGSQELLFHPGVVRPGSYLLDTGGAGSAPLLFQCLFYPLALAGGGTLTLRGGTHVPCGPSYHYLAALWLPAVQAYGLEASLRLVHAGFPPEGAGEFRAEVSPVAQPPERVVLPARGTLQDIAVVSLVGGLPFGLAERQSRAAVAALRERGIYCHAENRPLHTLRSAGSATFIVAQFEHTVAGFTALGEKGGTPEEVGRRAAEALARFMESGGALEEHLADQLLMPAALLASGRLGPVSPGTTSYTTERVTEHLRVQAWVLERFLPVRIQVDPTGSVAVGPG